jgi:hypothetical protein
MSELDATTFVLLEGRSDAAAVRTLAARLGVSLEGVSIVDLGGVTNVGRVARELSGSRVTGMCDVGEERFFAKALDDYVVCDADLEDELIRALGVEGTERVIELEGQLPLLRTFQNQPWQRTRTPEQQMRRFFGTTSGRKEQYGRALVEGLDLARIPQPLTDLLEKL